MPRSGQEDNNRKAAKCPEGSAQGTEKLKAYIIMQQMEELDIFLNECQNLCFLQFIFVHIYIFSKL